MEKYHAIARERTVFPRSSERGPIEASFAGSGSAGVNWSFPRSSERGPIEASKTHTASFLSDGFPRSSERGPIEAL